MLKTQDKLTVNLINIVTNYTSRISFDSLSKIAFR